MIIAFKNQASGPGDFVNKVIGYWTDSPWIHCELLLSSPRQLAVSVRPANYGVAVDSWESVLVKPETWDFFVVPTMPDDQIWSFLVGQVGMKFNFKGLIAGQVFKASFLQPESWFCSELAYSTITQFGLISLPVQNPTLVSPALLHQYLLESSCQQLTYQQLNY